MNKKHWVTISLAVLVLLGGILAIVLTNAAAAFKPLKDGPVNTGTVSGNGGNAVAVDGWVYFIGNYYSDVTTIGYKQNEYNSLPNNNFGAIYRVKVNAQGRPEYNMLEDESAENPYSAKNVQVVVPKIAGFANSAMWVFGNYLIYTSPNNMMDRLGTLQINKIDFFRVDLNGANHRKIYTTATDAVTAADFTVVYPSSNGIYLLVNDGGRLVRVNVMDKDFGKVGIIADTSTSFAFPIVSAFSTASVTGGNLTSSYNNGVMKYVYYTTARASTERLGGNRIHRYNIQTGASEVLAEVANKEYKVLNLASERLIYAVKDLGTGGTANDIYLTTGETNKIETASDFLRNVHNSELTEKYYLPTESTGSTPTVFLGFADSKIFIYRSENEYDLISDIYTEGMSANVKVGIILDVSRIVSVTSSRVFYLTSAGAVRAVNLSDGKPIGGTELLPSIENMTVTNTASYIKFEGSDGDRIFFIKDFTAGENTTNVAVLLEFWRREEMHENILGVVGEEYIADETTEESTESTETVS